ncbi:MULTISPECIES: MarR family winged helix-turn-helix transcriptional regulator [Micromonospora]|uniref:MarR family winged helix-turn-helix transcriptional regulator n=1 Tax=Micromonospora TaxID=1873 RepID=UPI001EE8C1CE|nr:MULTISPECIES: MarR family transcriptional regulator [Micromonospora]MCG5451324.1 MarR family transcriptional regulator [Micromonospora hortensis]MCX5116534.1 MarR family transcriptional regulator [Micromonospora sp. NBC_00362]WTI05208.1 MarR family transcriptional regulator [Micromonospora sp. NBC_00821]
MERPADLAAAIDAAAGTLIAVLESAASRHQVPPTQLRVLTLICGRPETNVNGLAELLDVGPSSASRLCDRLEATGLLRRVADPRDRREVRLVPTAAALTLLGELAERRQRAVQAVLDRMPARKQHELLLALAGFARAATSAPEQHIDPAVQTA